MTNQAYHNIEKWIDKYELKNDDCQDCKKTREIWGNNKIQSICFEHRWNNPIYSKETLKIWKIARHFLWGCLIVASLFSLGLAGYMLYSGFSSISQKNWAGLLSLLLFVFFLYLNCLFVWFWRMILKEFKEEIKAIERYGKDWKKRKNE